MSSDDDDTRTDYLAGAADGLLQAHARTDPDELRALLASPAIWVQPPARLEDDTVAAIVEAQVLVDASASFAEYGKG